MLEREREELILLHLSRNRFATVHDLVALTDTSEATIRRDLKRLDGDGRLRRVRGGAENNVPPRVHQESLVPPVEDLMPGASGPEYRGEYGTVTGPAVPTSLTRDSMPLRQRLAIQEDQKRRIAARAADMCSEGATLFIHGGSTTYYVGEFLQGRRVVIVTNSLAIATRTHYGLGYRTILAGGVVDPESELIFDPVGHNFFADYSAELLFMGVEGITSLGVTNTHSAVVRSARQMMEQSRRVIVLADSTKFGTMGHLKVCGIDRVDTVITDADAPEEECRLIQEAGVEVILV